MAEARGRFGRLGFVLAAAGSSIGLGNIWKFPYITYENGGGSFVLIYLVAIVVIGAPIMAAEIVLGRRARCSPVGAFLAAAKDSGRSERWASLGGLGVAAGFVILSYYSVVAGWTMYYFGKCVMWSLNGFSATAAANLGTTFKDFLGNGTMQVSFHAVFMVLTTLVVALGVSGGIERSVKLLMPLLLVILVSLALAATQWPGFSEAVSFLFSVNPIGPEAVLEAVGHSFFTLSLGMGAMITYGSYVSDTDSIPRASLTVCALDTVVSLLASVTMFSIIFSVPAAERATSFSESATILFTTLPRMFYQLPFGSVIAPVFYLLVAFAALTSTISLLEVVVAYFIDQRAWPRQKAALSMGALVFVCGIPAALSLGAVESLSEAFGGLGFFSAADYLASNWMLPLGGLGVALFVGFAMRSADTLAQLELGHGQVTWHERWRFALRYVAPVAIPSIIAYLAIFKFFFK